MTGKELTGKRRACLLGRPSRKAPTVKKNQIALQLYTLRNVCQNAKDLAATLKRVRQVGYTSVQASGLGPIPATEVRDILAGEGLTCCATHEPADAILQRPLEVVERLKTLNTLHTAYPWPAGVDFSDRAVVRKLADQLNESGRILRENGLTLSYHNHHLEFRRLDNKPVLEWLLEWTDPRNLKFELDTHWVQHGGADPVAWCRKVKGRMPVVHFKDYIINKENKIEFAEVGSGNLDWSAIIAACEASGVEWYVVEQDTCSDDPFVCIQRSYDFLSARAR